MFKGPDIDTLLLILVPMIATAVATAIYCYFQDAWKKRISFGVALLAAILVPFSILFVTNLFYDGLKVFTVSYWTADAGLAVLPVLLGFAAFLCFFPAVGVCVYFRAKQKK